MSLLAPTPFVPGALSAATARPPAFTTSPTASLSGRTVTVTTGVASGTPTPTYAVTMTLAGAPVTPTGTGPWSYVVASSEAAQALAWEVVASNGVAPADSASGIVDVPANLAAPGFTTQPTLSPASGAVGTVFTLSEGVASGSPAPTLTGVLTLDGVNVTPAGLSYTSTAEGALIWEVTAANGVSPNAVASASATVAAVVAPPAAEPQAFTAEQWALDDAAIDGATLHYSLLRAPDGVDMAAVDAIEYQTSADGGATWGAITTQTATELRYSKRNNRMGIYALTAAGATTMRVRLLMGATPTPWSAAKTATPSTRAAGAPSAIPSGYWFLRDLGRGDAIRVTFRGWAPDLAGYGVTWSSTGDAYNDIDFEIETGTVGAGDVITWSGAPFRLDHANAAVESSNESLGRAARNVFGLLKGQRYAVRVRQVVNRLTTPKTGAWSSPQFVTPTLVADRPALVGGAYLEGQRATVGGAVSIATAAAFTGATTFEKSDPEHAGYGSPWPAGLTLDAATGVIGGTAPAAGVYWLGVRARNASGVRDIAVELVVAAAGAFAAPAQTIQPGAKAVAGGGALRLSSTAGQITGLSALGGAQAAEWTIVGGDRLAPAGTSVTAGTFTVTATDGTSNVTVTVTVAPQSGVFTVLPRKAQIEAAWLAAADGDVIRVAPGASLDGRVTFAAKTRATPVTVEGVGFSAGSEPRASVRKATLAGGVALAGGCERLTLRGLRVAMHTNDKDALRGVVNLNGVGIVAATFDQLELTSKPILEVVEGDFTVREPTFVRETNAVLVTDLAVTKCWMHDVAGGMSGGFEASGLTWSGNVMHDTFAVWGMNGVAPIRLYDNLYWGLWAGAEDVDPNSTPIHAGLGGSSGRPDRNPVKDVKFIGNTVKVGADRFLHDGQQSAATGIKFNDPIVAGAYRDIEIAYNLIMVSSGIALEVSGGDGVLIHHNTLVPEPESNEFSSPAISGEGDEGMVKGVDNNTRYKTFDNIAEGGINLNPTWTDGIGDNRPGDNMLMWRNFPLTRDVTTPRATGAGETRKFKDYFAGHPTQPWGSLDAFQAMVAFTPKAWTDAKAENAGALGTPYYTYGDNGAHTTPDTLTGSGYTSYALDDRYAPPKGGAGTSLALALTTWPAGAGETDGPAVQTGAALSGLADGNVGTILAAVRFGAQTNTAGRSTDDLSKLSAMTLWEDTILDTNPMSISLARDVYGDLELKLYRADGTTTTLETWHRPISLHGLRHIAVSWDVANDRYRIAIDGRAVSWAASSFGSGNIGGSGPVAYTRSTNWRIGNGKFFGDAGMVAFDPRFVDLDTAAGLDAVFAADGKFKAPVSWLTDYRGDAAALNGAGGVNLGTAPQKFVRVSGPALTDTVADTVAPVLSAPAIASVSSTTASLKITTNEGGGTLFWRVTANATETAANVIAGGAVASGSRAVTNPVEYTLDATGLVGGTAYYFHAAHRDLAGNASTVSSTAFNTAVAVNRVLMPATAWVWLQDAKPDLAMTVAAQTVAFSVTAPSPRSGATYFIARAFDSYARINTSAFNVRAENEAGGVAYQQTTGLPSVAASPTVAVILTFDDTRCKLWVGGPGGAATITDISVSTSPPTVGTLFRGFTAINAVNTAGTNANEFTINGGYWIDNAYNDPATLAAALFDEGFNPRALPANGLAGGKVPTLYLDGNAAFWRSIARGVVADIVDV